MYTPLLVVPLAVRLQFYDGDLDPSDGIDEPTDDLVEFAEWMLQEMGALLVSPLVYA